MKKKIVLLVTLVLLVSLLSACQQPNQNVSSVFEDTTLESIIDSIYEKHPIEIMVGNISIDLEDSDQLYRFTGLKEHTQIQEVLVSESMMSAQAYSMVLVRVKDASTAPSVAQLMMEGIDPGKWICVFADDVRVVACDDVILLVMLSSSFSDMATTDDFVEAFKAISGKNLSVDLI